MCECWDIKLPEHTRKCISVRACVYLKNNFCKMFRTGRGENFSGGSIMTSAALHTGGISKAPMLQRGFQTRRMRLPRDWAKPENTNKHQVYSPMVHCVWSLDNATSCCTEHVQWSKSPAEGRRQKEKKNMEMNSLAGGLLEEYEYKYITTSGK